MNERNATTPTTRVVAITGAAQGLGRAYAQRFAEDGMSVVAMDIQADALNRVAEEITQRGGQCVPMPVDIGDPDSVERVMAAIDQRFGRCDVLVNNAAIFSSLKMRSFEEIPYEEWSRVLHVNITGTFLMSREAAPLMRRRQWGRIINVSSAAVVMGRAHYLHYTTSKAAVIGMTRSMARELGPDGITVNALLPGATDTGVPRETVSPAQKQAQIAMRCIQREEGPQDLVGVVRFLASEDSGFFTGQSLVVDGGLTFL